MAFPLILPERSCTLAAGGLASVQRGTERCSHGVVKKLEFVANINNNVRVERASNPEPIFLCADDQ